MAKAKTSEPEKTELDPIEAAEPDTKQPAEVMSVKQSDRPVRLIYVGPNISGGILQRFQVFKGGYPPYCKDLFEKIPEVKELFVPVEALEESRRKIEESGTNEARLFYIVQQATAKGVK